MNLAIRLIVAAITLCFCLAYWVVDSRLIDMMNNRSYGELYGPLSYFHPLLFWLLVSSTIVCIAVLLMPMRSRA